MTYLNQLNQWARHPKQNDPETWAKSAAMLNQVIEAERKKERAIRRRGRAFDRSGCCQIEFGFLRLLGVCDGAD